MPGRAHSNARKATSKKACFYKAAKAVKTMFPLALPVKTQSEQRASIPLLFLISAGAVREGLPTRSRRPRPPARSLIVGAFGARLLAGWWQVDALFQTCFRRVSDVFQMRFRPLFAVCPSLRTNWAPNWPASSARPIKFACSGARSFASGVSANNWIYGGRKLGLSRQLERKRKFAASRKQSRLRRT